MIFIVIWFISGYVGHMIMFYVMKGDIDVIDIWVSAFLCVFGPVWPIIYCIMQYQDKIVTTLAIIPKFIKKIKVRLAAKSFTQQQIDTMLLYHECTNVWNVKCPHCGKKAMRIVKPGKIQCENCGY